MKRAVVLFSIVISLISGSVYAQDSNVLIGLGSPSHGITIKANFPTGTGGWARGFRISNEDFSQPFVMLGTYGTYTNGQATQVYSYIGPSHASPHLTFRPSGNVGIGTTDPQAKLAVNGNILAKEVKVKTDITVPDYVFEPGYELPSLVDVEAYVKEHRHLPEIPSAADIARDGLDLAEMNLLLLKKVEELTLHLIRVEKEKIEMNDRIAALESK